MFTQTLEQVEAKLREAYSRFKAYVYYDNFNLALRSQLAAYENDPNLNNKLKILASELYHYLEGGPLSVRIQDLISNSNYIVLPKTFKNADGSQKKNRILISNQTTDKYYVEKSTTLFSGDIDLQLIATLWIMEEGVKLQKIIGNDSYGYHLPMHKEKIKLGSEKLLFTRYFEKYQEWRDKGIRAAKAQIDVGNDVLLISLDIQNFFHSCEIDFDSLKKDLNSNQTYSLTSIIESICVIHSQKIGSNNKLPLLPIGLVSSGVIANWLLSDFDKSLKDKMAPVYYGRYVDDFFIVVSNVKPPKETETTQETYVDNVNDTITWLAERFFSGEEPLKKSNEENDICLKFSNEKYRGLKIQAEKLKLFYFSPNWPLAMLNKFQKTLEENSSAFWFLPDEENLKNSLDDEAYDMHYEDTINKFRSVANVKASKYGASVFLAKRIKLAILHSDSFDEKITAEVFRFFRGVATLSFYSMWEKVFSYMVVTNDISGIKKLHKQILKALNELKAHDKENDIKSTLRTHLDVSLEMALSLEPKIVASSLNNESSIEAITEDITNGINNLRFSLLTRHHYLSFPSLVLTDYYSKTSNSLLSGNLIGKLLDDKSQFTLNETLRKENWRVPRWIHLQEICTLYFFLELKEWKLNNKKVLFFDVSKDEKNNMIYTETHILNCCTLFKDLNNRDISRSINSTKFKTYRDNKIPEPRICSNIITIESELEELKLKIGLSNMKVHSDHLKAAIIDKSLITREKRNRHIKLLNIAEVEDLDLLVLPETSVPLEWLYAYSDESRRKQRAFIFGLEHFTISNYCFNFSVGLFPFKLGKMREVFVAPRLKNHYSPGEQKEIRKIGKDVPKPITSFYNLFKWRSLQFTIYNCYELTDVVHRSIFRSELDILFAIEYNKDTNYFSNIAEATARDLHCYYVQANTSDFGDTRIVEPSETNKMNLVRVKGGENDIVLRYELDIRKLRAFQVQRLPYQMEDDSYKTTPPDFDHERVNKRGKR